MLFRMLPNINNRATHCFIQAITSGHFPNLAVYYLHLVVR
jgi:hypothetical protein